MSCGCSNNNRCDGPCAATVTRVLRCDGRFCTFLRLLEQACLLEYLESAKSITLFAPTDAAFDKLSEGTLQCLCRNPEQLKKVLLTHVLDGARTVSQLAMAPPQSWTTLEGACITIDFRSNPSRTVVIDPLNRCATIVDPNRKACNATIQVINTVLFPFATCCVNAVAPGSCGVCQCMPRSLGAPADGAVNSSNCGGGCGCCNNNNNNAAAAVNRGGCGCAGRN